MKGIFFLPYGEFHQEAEFIGSLADNLIASGIELTQLVCNGVFTLCERDASNGWHRGLLSCLNCQSEQEQIIKENALLQKVYLSHFITPKSVAEISQWINGYKKNDLYAAVWNGIEVAKLSEKSLTNRKGNANDAAAEEAHTRRQLLSSARLAYALNTFFESKTFDFAVLPAGEDFISNIYLNFLKKNRIKTVTISWQPQQKGFIISQLDNGKLITYQGEIVADHSTLLSDLGIVANQLRLKLG